MRADRLLRLILLLHARGRMTASALASELEVTERTVYRDVQALSSAGVPVFTESGPGGGVELLDTYTGPLSALLPEEASALLMLGTPEPLHELGLTHVVETAHDRVRTAAGLREHRALVHLDLPRWFHAREEVPALPDIAAALQAQSRLSLRYQAPRRPPASSTRAVDPLGIVNKAGVWYLVAHDSDRTTVFRVARITQSEILDEPSHIPADFDLASFWREWSSDFQASLPSVAVVVRASPRALLAFPEVLGDGVNSSIAAGTPPDSEGWRTITLTFEHHGAACHALAGFGELVEVMTQEVRERLIANAQGTLAVHGLR